jgi:putative addiction module component
MNERARRLLKEALELPAEERAMLCAEIEATLEEADSPETIEAAWREEIAHRIREIEEGTVELLDGEAVLAELHAKYPARR